MSRQYTIEELDFALKVRELASTIRDGEMPAQFRNGAESKEKEEWLAYHPISMYVPKAIHLITQVADQIHTMNEVHEDDRGP